jgi:hypothetical protein
MEAWTQFLRSFRMQVDKCSSTLQLRFKQEHGVHLLEELKQRRVGLMRVWYVLMASFLILMAALALLLGSLDCLKENHRVTRSQMDVTVIAQEAYRLEQETMPCPWQLEFVTLGTKGGITRASMSYN